MPTPPFQLYEYAARAVYVVDGDTLDLEVDLGFRVRITQRFRLYGVNTPERGKPGYAEAKSYLETAVLDKPLQIRTRLDAEDKYGRMLAEVYRYFFPTDSWLSVADEMVKYGLGVPA